jgi:hypothetical protein
MPTNKLLFYRKECWKDLSHEQSISEMYLIVQCLLETLVCILYRETSRNFKLIILKFSDTFLSMVSTSMGTSYQKIVRHNVIVSFSQHICNF